MNNLINFKYNNQQVRTVILDSEPWFVAKDVCDILEHTNSRMALERLEDDEKGVSLIDTLGGRQEMSIVNEPGLYSLIFGSRKPEAKAFKRWVTHEVLPTLRKTGSYTTPGNTSAETDPVISELSKRLTLSEIAVLFETRLVNEDKQRSGEKIEVLVQSGEARRRHCKVDKYQLGDEVKARLRAGETYEAITFALNNRGIEISLSSVHRYGQRYLKELNRQEVVMPNGIKLIQEHGKITYH